MRKWEQFVLPISRIYNLTKNPIFGYTFDGDILVIPSASPNHINIDNEHYYIVDEIPKETTSRNFIKVLWTGQGRGGVFVSGLALFEQPKIRIYLSGE